MPKARVAKKNFVGHPDGKKPAGKPRNIWKGDVRKDAADLLGARKWRRLARDRDG